MGEDLDAVGSGVVNLNSKFKIDSREFRDRFQSFRKVDYKSYPYCFGEFWKWRLKKETKNEHILNSKNMNETFNRLSQTLKIWRWHRPYSFEEMAKRLRKTLEKIREAYTQIRSYSLMQINEAPNDALELIWHQLGCVKTGEERNPAGYYLVMPITKPLMFLWGQTLAFDDIVRGFMPRFNMVGIKHNYWTFEKWKRVMVNFQKNLKQQTKILDLFKEVSRKEYGTDSTVPYGQFLDLYYWRQLC